MDIYRCADDFFLFKTTTTSLSLSLFFFLSPLTFDTAIKQRAISYRACKTVENVAQWSRDYKEETEEESIKGARCKGNEKEKNEGSEER